jgi:hypothetical protein
VTTAWRTLPAALLAATVLTGVPGTAAAAEPRATLVLVQRVRDTVSLACAPHAGKITCAAVHRPRPYLTAGYAVTSFPAPPAPRPRAPHRRTPAAFPGLR